MQQDNIIMAPFRNPLIAFISEVRYRWLRHTLFIVICLILGFKGDIGGYSDQRSMELRKAFWMVDIWTTAFIMSMIYLLLLVLIPKFLFRSKVFAFAICFFVIISLIYFFVWYADVYYLWAIDDKEHPRLQHVEFSVIAYIQYCAISAVLLGSVVGLAIFKKWINDINHLNALHETNLRTELEQLKSQVNPHFLFNTLNNLFVLTKTDPEKASQVILGLSDLLRYQLYDSAKEKILLSKDIDFAENLLALEKIRKNDFEYHLEITGNINGISVPPFLFIPFIENAIKHGASTVGHSYLNVAFSIQENHLFFYSENSKPAVKRTSIGGLGLGNIKRRLQLLYPGKHQLEIKDYTEKYIVNLSLPL